MAEEALDYAEVCALFQEMGGVGVTEGVDADIFGYSCFSGCFLDD